MVRGAIRMAMTSCVLPLCACGGKIARPKPFRRAQVPAVRLGQFAGRLQMCGDQSCVLVGGAAVACLNGGGQHAMGLLAVDA
jgi:hypothetical protein